MNKIKSVILIWALSFVYVLQVHASPADSIVVGGEALETIVDTLSTKPIEEEIVLSELDTLSQEKQSTGLILSVDSVLLELREDPVQVAIRDSIEWARKRDSIYVATHIENSLHRSWRTYQVAHPYDSIAHRIAMISEGITPPVSMFAHSDTSKYLFIDSLLQVVDSMPKDYWLCYAQPSYQLPVIAYTHIPGVTPLTLSPPVLPGRAEAFDDGMPKVEAIFERQAEAAEMRRMALHKYFIACPTDVEYYLGTMAKAPEKHHLSNEHVIQEAQIEVPDYVFEFKPLPERNQFQVDPWRYRGENILQMTHTAISDNWYRGGENNMNFFSQQKFEIKRYDPSQKTTFEANFDLKLSFYVTKSDTVHPVRLNDNLFRVDLKYGYKAWKTWYYSSSFTFKTPMFNLYGANSKTLKNSFLSPAEMNLNVGMDYKYNKKGRVTYSILLAPLSYSMKYVQNQRVNVTNYGIEANRRALNQWGSSITSKLEWVITSDIAWTSRLYVFTNYEDYLGEFENTFTFKVNRYFSARLDLYPRFDNGSNKQDHWQMKEMFTFGFDYVW